MPARLFQDLKPRSAAAVRHAIEAINNPSTDGLLVIQIRNGKSEHRWVDGPAEVYLDPWRDAARKAG